MGAVRTREDGRAAEGGSKASAVRSRVGAVWPLREARCGAAGRGRGEAGQEQRAPRASTGAPGPGPLVRGILQGQRSSAEYIGDSE